ncbi:MAG: hypothetical protein ABIC19_00355 [Patescibacteria group bacterium]
MSNINKNKKGPFSGVNVWAITQCAHMIEVDNLLNYYSRPMSGAIVAAFPAYTRRDDRDDDDDDKD